MDTREWSKRVEGDATWSGIAEKFVIRAMRDIHKDEEVLISYIRLLEPCAERWKQVGDNYGIDCACPLCHLAKHDLGVSDEWRRLLGEWNKELTFVRDVGKVASKALKHQVRTCEKLVSELAKEPTLMDERCIK